MATPEQRLSFVGDNYEEIKSLLDMTNGKRLRDGRPVLTQAEADAGVDEIIEGIASGALGKIREYVFKDYNGVLVDKRQAEASPQKPQGEKFSFDVIKCANGFLMNMTQDNASKTFIFKTQIELGDIFNQVLFLEEKNGIEIPEVES